MDLENKKYDLEKAKEDCRRHEDALEEAQSCMCGHCHECGFDPSEMKAAPGHAGKGESGMHRGALAALVERGLNGACLRKIREESAPLGMPQKVVQRLKSEGIILRAHEYHKDHYVWRPGPKFDHFMKQLVAMEERIRG